MARAQRYEYPIRLDDGLRAVTLAGNLTLDDDSYPAQALDPDGVDRTVTFPAAISGRSGWVYVIKHAGTANIITVDTTSVLVAGGWGAWMCDGSAWVAQLANNDRMMIAADPGTLGAIPVDRSTYVNLVTGASGQTRTVADPTRVGVRLTLYFLTDGGGDCVVTFTSPVNAAGNNTLTFDTATEVVHLESVKDGASAYAFRIVANEAGTPLTTVP